MKYRLNIQMDLTIEDDKYSNITKHKRKKPIGKPKTIIGTEEEIIDKLNGDIFELIDLAKDIYIKGEENVTI